MSLLLMQGQVFSQRKFFDRIKQSLGSLAAALVTVAKVAPVFLKTGGSMIFMVFIYSRILGWPYAVGFVLLIFVHEAGHLIAARMMGLQVGWPVFIPFMGALIALKEAPRNAWVEAVVGIGGPILGSIGALAVWSAYFFTGNVLFLALGYAGFFINLFNLIPIVPLDGGRIVTAISPWFWLLGLIILVPVLLVSKNIFLIIILIFLLVQSLPRVIALFRKRTDFEQRYFECTRAQRVLIAVLYFSLLAGLGTIMHYTEPLLPKNQISSDENGSK
ncbi:MAG: site-2 protease family protein [Chthoniobacteraceae bacterium]